MAETNSAGAAILAAAQKQIADATFAFVDVAEWPDADGNPSRIWYRPMVTVNEAFAISSWKSDTGDGRYRQAYILIRRALDQNGVPLFNIGDEAALLELDWNVLKWVADKLLDGKPKVDDAKKG